MLFSESTAVDTPFFDYFRENNAIFWTRTLKALERLGIADVQFLITGELYDRPAGCIMCPFGMPRLTYSKREAIRQAVAMQRYCVEGAELLGRDLAASDDKELRARIATGLSNLIKGWRTAEDAKRVLKGEPLPGSYKSEKRKSKQDYYPGMPMAAPLE